MEQTSADPDQSMISGSCWKMAWEVHLNGIHATVNVTQNQIWCVMELVWVIMRLWTIHVTRQSFFLAHIYSCFIHILRRLYEKYDLILSLYNFKHSEWWFWSKYEHTKILVKLQQFKEMCIGTSFSGSFLCGKICFYYYLATTILLQSWKCYRIT
jgi:hypothetical protein